MYIVRLFGSGLDENEFVGPSHPFCCIQPQKASLSSSFHAQVAVQVLLHRIIAACNPDDIQFVQA